MKSKSHLSNPFTTQITLSPKGQNRLTNKMLKMGLFEVKELQIQNKNDQQNHEKYSSSKLRHNDMNQRKDQTHQDQRWDEEQVKTSFMMKSQDHDLDKLMTVKNFKRENEQIQEERNLHILLKKRDSNVNYLQLQIRQLLKLTHYNILHEQEKQLKTQVSKLQISCRKLKIAIRNKNSSLSKSPQSKLQLKNALRKQQQIQQQKSRFQQLQTKLILLENYYQRKLQSINHSSIEEACSPEHRDILLNRISLLQQSIEHNRSYIVDKEQRLKKQNGILRKELQILKADLEKVTRIKSQRKRHLRFSNQRSIKKVMNVNTESTEKSLKKDKFTEDYEGMGSQTTNLRKKKKYSILDNSKYMKKLHSEGKYKSTLIS